MLSPQFQQIPPQDDGTAKASYDFSHYQEHVDLNRSIGGLTTSINQIKGINALAFGADPTGTADSAPAIQAALNVAAPAHRKVYLPTGNYTLNTGLTVPNFDGAGMFGDGPYSTTLTATFTNGDVILSGASIFAPVFRDMRITRTAQAVAGAGVNMNTSCDRAQIRNLILQNHQYGLLLRNTAFSWVDSCLVENCSSHGVFLNGGTVDSLQWNLNSILAQNNGGYGFNATSLSAAQTGPLEQWSNLATFNNTQGGILLNGCTAARMVNCFLGNDGVTGGLGGEVNITNSGPVGSVYAHTLTNVFIEVGALDGFFFSTTVNDSVCMNNCAAVQCVSAGIVWGSNATLMVNGGDFRLNGSGGVNPYGLYMFAGTGSASVVGAIIPSAGSQTTGINGAAGTNLSVYACKTSGILSGGITGLFSQAGNYA